MNLFRTRSVTTKLKPAICQCVHCGNPQALADEKCFYCHQFQPSEPVANINSTTLHGVDKKREQSFVDIAFDPFTRSMNKYFDLCKQHKQIGMVTKYAKTKLSPEPKLLPVYVREV